MILEYVNRFSDIENIGNKLKKAMDTKGTQGKSGVQLTKEIKEVLLKTTQGLENYAQEVNSLFKSDSQMKDKFE